MPISLLEEGEVDIDESVYVSVYEVTTVFAYAKVPDGVTA